MVYGGTLTLTMSVPNADSVPMAGLRRICSCHDAPSPPSAPPLPPSEPPLPPAPPPDTLADVAFDMSTCSNNTQQLVLADKGQKCSDACAQYNAECVALDDDSPFVADAVAGRQSPFGDADEAGAVACIQAASARFGSLCASVHAGWGSVNPAFSFGSCFPRQSSPPSPNPYSFCNSASHLYSRLCPPACPCHRLRPRRRRQRVPCLRRRRQRRPRRRRRRRRCRRSSTRHTCSLSPSRARRCRPAHRAASSRLSRPKTAPRRSRRSMRCASASTSTRSSRCRSRRRLTFSQAAPARGRRGRTAPWSARRRTIKRRTTTAQTARWRT